MWFNYLNYKNIRIMVWIEEKNWFKYERFFCWFGFLVFIVLRLRDGKKILRWDYNLIVDCYWRRAWLYYIENFDL